jgi:hypothetical protein
MNKEISVKQWMKNVALVCRRDSADAVQYIGCSNAASAGSTIVLCEAQDAAGVYRTCVTTDVNMVATARSLSESSHLYFQWDASGNCTPPG